MRKLTKEDFINKSKKKFGEYTFDYSLTKYIDYTTSVKLICKNHGMIDIIPKNHLKSVYGCKKCGEENCSKTNASKYTKERFIKDAKKKFNDNFNYTKVIYNTDTTKTNEIVITCKIHGDFLTNVEKFLSSKHGCPDCAQDISTNFHKDTKEDFIRKAKLVHGDKYNYDSVVYKKSNKIVDIYCKKCKKVFPQLPGGHINGAGCPDCGALQASRTNFNNKKTAFWKTIREKKIDHRYDLSKFKYLGILEHSIAICKEKNHGEFPITPDNLKRGKGCPICRKSKAETFIREWLIDNNINFIEEAHANNKKYFAQTHLTKSRFDFLIHDYKIIIEYDGIQHFMISDFSKKEEKNIQRAKCNFEKLKKADKEKDLLAKKSGYSIIRIPYWEFDNGNLNYILENLLIKKDINLIKKYSLDNNRKISQKKLVPK